MSTANTSFNGSDTEVLGPFPHPVEFHFPNLRRETVSRVAPMSQTAKPLEPEADTFGWDTVFAINITDVNREILRSGAAPTIFHQEDTDGTMIQGKFAPWQLCRGGDGDLVHLSIPITEGVMHFDGKSYPMAGITVVVEVRLRYISQVSTTTRTPVDNVLPLQETRKSLVLRATATALDEPPVSVQPLRFSGQTPPQVAQWVMEGILQAWFVAHINNFTQVFATAVLNRKVDQDGFQWLAPQYTGYAYTDGDSDETSYLGVLCMTRRANAAGLTQQLSRTAIPKNARAGFLISQGLFLEKMVLPALPKAFPDATARDFVLTPQNTAITNTRPIKTKTVTHDGITYQPELEELTIRVVGDELQVESNTQVELSAGIFGHVRSAHFVRLKLVKKPDGSQTISYEESRDPIVDTPWTTLSPGIEIGKILLEIFAVIVTMILTVVTSGAFLIVALIIVGLVVGLAIAAPDIVAAVLKREVTNDVPAIDLLVMNSTAPITWTGAAEFKLTQIGLNGSLQLGGDPGFSLA